jgi:cytochrome c5
MMNTLKRISVEFLFLAAMPVLSQTGNTGKAPASSGQQQTKSNAGQLGQTRDGQQVFYQNCSRCHNQPPVFSPRICGTVARHMRVRAGLSKEDAQAVLLFLIP